MKPLRVLVCGGDYAALRQLAQQLSDEGVKVATSTRLIDYLCLSNQEWDLLLVDLDSLTSFLRGLLPAVRVQFCNLNIVGFSRHASFDVNFVVNDLKLDDCLLDIPKPEDLIVRIPNLAANDLCDTNSLRALAFDSQPLAV
jgi:hypothetical protein